MNRELDATIAKEIFGLSDRLVSNPAYLCPLYSSNFVQAIRLAKHVRLPMSVNDMPEQAEQLACAALHHHRKLEQLREDLAKNANTSQPNQISDNADNTPTKPR